VASPNTEAPSVQEYYGSLESRLGNWFVLGNTRHFGLYQKNQFWPFLIAIAQRAMEEKLYTLLALPPGARVLDPGAGSGYVAIYITRKGLDVQAIHITPHHLADARKIVGRNGLEKQIAVSFGDYHELSSFADGSFHGIYTMETFVHADDAAKVLRNFHRFLKPGGVVVMPGADFNKNSKLFEDVRRLSHCQNTLVEGEYERLLKETGFVKYSIEDLTDQVLPLWRFFALLGYGRYQIFRLLGIQHRFTNVMAGVETWKHWGEGRYISVRAVKPL
jgi:sterol 24-C-methyltransferase